MKSKGNDVSKSTLRSNNAGFFELEPRAAGFPPVGRFALPSLEAGGCGLGSSPWQPRRIPSPAPCPPRGPEATSRALPRLLAQNPGQSFPGRRLELRSLRASRARGEATVTQGAGKGRPRTLTPPPGSPPTLPARSNRSPPLHTLHSPVSPATPSRRPRFPGAPTVPAPPGLSPRVSAPPPLVLTQHPGAPDPRPQS